MAKFKEYFLGPFIFGEAINSEPFEDNHFFLDNPVARKKELVTTGQGVFKKQNPKLDFNEINSNYFRSEEFKVEHSGLHILFSGCSYTLGHGMEYEKVWSKLLYNNISNSFNTSGYFNLGVGGASLMECVSLIFKYCKTYGNPNVIFLNIPDFVRFYSIDEDKIRFSFLINKDDKVLNLLAYQYYFMLDLYCKSNNIKLYSFSWAPCEDKEYLGIENSKINNFSTYHKYNLSDVDSFVKKYLYENDNAKLMADDNEHLGEAYHQYWYDFIYKKYINDNTRN